jgi:FAD/FMN-containing dehydrogenase
MEETKGVEARNWFGDIRSNPHVVVRPGSVHDISAVVRETEKYPSPIRAAGSNHSTTRCVVADSGTVVDMTGMNRILEISADTVTAEAGALYIDVARALQQRGLQFFVNIELGNLTMGSAACTHTKEASFPGEYGIVASYCIGMKVVTHAGDILEVTEEQPELLRAMRSSFGLLGIVYEVTFRVKPLRPMAVRHRTFRLAEFERELPALKATGESIMYYLFPFQDRVMVELREYMGPGAPKRRAAWKLRNLVWRTGGPTFGTVVSRWVPGYGLRTALLEGSGRTMQLLGRLLLRGSDTNPVDQMIRYPKESGFNRYTFSIWAFPEADFPRVLREYFEFSRRYYREYGYRCNTPNVGYRISRDRSALFSYTHDGTVMTVDPVSTGGPGWPEFLAAYNEFCSRNGGTPLFNQTPWLTPEQVAAAFGARLESFRGLQQRFDPQNRFLNQFFAELLGLPGESEVANPDAAEPSQEVRAP